MEMKLSVKVTDPSVCLPDQLLLVQGIPALSLVGVHSVGSEVTYLLVLSASKRTSAASCYGRLLLSRSWLSFLMASTG